MDHDALGAYDLILPRKIVFGWGRREEMGPLAASLGRRAFLVCGSETLDRSGVVAQIDNYLQQAGVELIGRVDVHHEPEVTDVDHAAAEIRRLAPGPGDLVIGLGGGAAIDLAKATAAMAVNAQSDTVKDYLEGVGRGLQLEEAPLPVLAMPTTAGTGAEATKNAVISSYNPPFKKSLRDERLVPAIALIDPELSVSVPPDVTAASGMDAITQLIESYVTRRAQPLLRVMAEHALRLAIHSLADAVADGTSQSAREAMSHAALVSGICLANAGLGMAHGVAPALGVHARVPHGLACALMLPTAIRVNATVAKDELLHLARSVLNLRTSLSAEEAIGLLAVRIEALSREVSIPTRLSEVGVTPEMIPDLVASSRGSSMKGNPRELTDEELTELLEAQL